MAGEWLKMEACTPEKSEVLAITDRMGWEDADLTVGKLFRVWRWFDQQTTDGNAAGVTTALLDRIVGVTGFCDAMRSVGWLCVHEGGVSLPNFDRHNGTTAKSRAQTAKRVAKHKANATGNAQTVTNALPREEKRREDTSSLRSEVEAPRKRAAVPQVARPDDVAEQTWADWQALRKAKKAPVTETVIQQARREADKAGMPLDDFLRIWCARGSQGLQADWIKPNERQATHTSFAQQDELAKRRRWEEMTGRKWPGGDSDVIDMDAAPAAALELLQ